MILFWPEFLFFLFFVNLAIFCLNLTKFCLKFWTENFGISAPSDTNTENERLNHVWVQYFFYLHVQSVGIYFHGRMFKIFK